MNHFFKITSKRTLAEGSYTYVVDINANHRVFAGHFPGNPIVPGVMSMMMVRMLAEDAMERVTHYATVKDCKYLQTIIPNGTPLTVNITTDGTNLSGEILSSEGVALMKIKSILE